MRRLLPILVVLAVLPATASAATGDLTQLTNPFGCHWFNQTDGVCQATTALHQPESIAISADGTSVYVANAQSESVVHFQRDPATGIINQPDDPTGCVSDTGSGPCVDGERLLFAIAVAVSPDGRNVYAGAANSSGVVILDRDPATGLLSQRTSGTLGCVSSDGSGGACVAAAGLDAVEDLVVSPDGENVYVASENGVVTLNRTEPLGDLQPGGCINEFGTGGCDNGKALWDTRGVTVSPDGKSVFTVSAGAGADDVDAGLAVFTRASGGTLTPASCISSSGSGGECTDGRAVDTAFDVAVSPDDKSVYLPDRNGSIAVFDRDPETLTVTQKADVNGCLTQNPTSATNEPCVLGHDMPSPTGLAVSPDGKNVYMSSQDLDGVVIFDRATDTGVLTQRPSPAGCVAGPGFYLTNNRCTAVHDMPDAWDMVVAPDGRHLYVAAHGDRVGILTREGGTPVETPTPTPTPGPGETVTPSPSPTATATPVRLPPTFPPPRIRTVQVNVRNGNVTVTADADAAGTVTVTADGRVTVSSRSASTARKKKVRIAKASKTVAEAGPVTLVLKPKGKAKKVLRRKGKLKATLTTTFTPAFGVTPKVSTRKVTFKFKK